MTKPRDLSNLGGGFIQSGTGAVQRTVENKLKDTVSVKDFGAVGGWGGRRHLLPGLNSPP
jgi:hypothetical protein